MGFNTVEAEILAQKIERLVEDASFDPDSLGQTARRRLSEAARKLSLATELPGDTIHRVSLLPLQLPLAKIGADRGVFDALVNSNGAPVSCAQLEKRTDIRPALLKRLLRYYQSVELVAQTSGDSYRANNITRALVTPAGRAGLDWHHELVVPSVNALPKFLQENRHTDLSDGVDLPFNAAFNYEGPLFEWIHERPEKLSIFMGWMAGQRFALPGFLEAEGFDFRREFASGADRDTVAFVDVGGSMGHQCVAFRKKYPDLAGRVVLQDLPETIRSVRENPLPGMEGVELMAHDFFRPQSLKGARTYYLRNVLHDWPDDKCVQILRNLIPALTSPDSRILIDEMMLPEMSAPWRATQQDIVMGTCVAARERSRSEWLTLFESAGLSVERIWTYTRELYDCLIVLAPREGINGTGVHEVE